MDVLKLNSRDIQVGSGVVSSVTLKVQVILFSWNGCTETERICVEVPKLNVLCLVLFCTNLQQLT